MEAFLQYVTKMFAQDAAVDGKLINKVLDFAVKFCVQIAFPADSTADEAKEIETHPLLMGLVYEIEKVRNSFISGCMWLFDLIQCLI